MRKKTAAFVLCVLLLLPCETAAAKGAGTGRDSAAQASPPVSLQAASYSYDKIRLTWERAEQAEAYTIYRAASAKGKYKKIHTVAASRTGYIDRGLKTGKTYYYKIRAVQKNGKKAGAARFSKIVKASPRPIRVRELTGEYQMAGAFLLTWKPVRGADGYQLQIKTASDSKWQDAYRPDEETVSRPREVSGDYQQKHYLKGNCARWDLSSEETSFRFRIRAYHKENGKKIFGAYSAPLRMEPVWNSAEELRSYVQDWVRETYPGYLPEASAALTPETGNWGAEWGNCQTVSRYASREKVLRELCSYKLKAYFEKNYFAQGEETPHGSLYLRDLGDGTWRVWWLD